MGAALDGDKSFVLQNPEGLAHGGTRDVEQVDEGGLVRKRVTGGQLTPQDPRPQVGGHQLRHLRHPNGLVGPGERAQRGIAHEDGSRTAIGPAGPPKPESRIESSYFVGLSVEVISVSCKSRRTATNHLTSLAS